MKKPLQILITVALIVGAFFGGLAIAKQNVNNDSRAAKKVGEAFAQNIAAGNFDTAYAIYGSSKFQEGSTVDEFKTDFVKAKDATVAKDSGTIYTGETASLYIEPITLKDSTTSSIFNVILTKENGKWKVLSAVVQ